MGSEGTAPRLAVLGEVEAPSASGDALLVVPRARSPRPSNPCRPLLPGSALPGGARSI